MRAILTLTIDYDSSELSPESDAMGVASYYLDEFVAYALNRGLLTGDSALMVKQHRYEVELIPTDHVREDA